MNIEIDVEDMWSNYSFYVKFWWQCFYGSRDLMIKSFKNWPKNECINVYDKEKKYTPLHIYVAQELYRNQELSINLTPIEFIPFLMQKCIKNGCDINQKTKSGKTILFTIMDYIVFNIENFSDINQKEICSSFFYKQNRGFLYLKEILKYNPDLTVRFGDKTVLSYLFDKLTLKINDIDLFIENHQNNLNKEILKENSIEKNSHILLNFMEKTNIFSDEYLNVNEYNNQNMSLKSLKLWEFYKTLIEKKHIKEHVIIKNKRNDLSIKKI